MIKSCVFETPIARSYLRNNRSTRQKSLRCFPACDPRGHIAAGFCGIPLRVRIHLTSTDECEPEINIHSFVFVAETRPSNTSGISSRSIVSKQSIMQNIRTKSDKASEKGELFIGDVTVVAADCKSMELLVTFNAQHCSWDYSWKSNRWSGSQEQHVVDIVVLKYSSLSDFVVCSSCPSSPFIVASSHKRSCQRPEQSDAEVLQASTLLTTLCAPVGDDQQEPADGGCIVVHAEGGDLRPSPNGSFACDSHSRSRSSSTSDRPKRPCSNAALAEEERQQQQYQHHQHLMRLQHLQQQQPQFLLHGQPLQPQKSPSRDHSLAEGAETLMSLLGPLVQPRAYMYDQASKRQRLHDEFAGPQARSGNPIRDFPVIEAGQSTHAPDGTNASLNLIFLPVRE